MSKLGRRFANLDAVWRYLGVKSVLYTYTINSVKSDAKPQTRWSRKSSEYDSRFVLQMETSTRRGDIGGGLNVMLLQRSIAGRRPRNAAPAPPSQILH